MVERETSERAVRTERAGVASALKLRADGVRVPNGCWKCTDGARLITGDANGFGLANGSRTLRVLGTARRAPCAGAARRFCSGTLSRRPAWIASPRSKTLCAADAGLDAEPVRRWWLRSRSRGSAGARRVCAAVYASVESASEPVRECEAVEEGETSLLFVLPEVECASSESSPGARRGAPSEPREECPSECEEILVRRFTSCCVAADASVS
jgi:hypothetical protein